MAFEEALLREGVMNNLREKWERRAREKSGFTLIEILIVVILMGILATIIIPQISVSTEDAKINSLKTNLSNMRSAVELYYFQHNNKYPGMNDIAGAATAVDGTATIAFGEQLTKYTDINGVVSNSKTGSYIFGPYLSGATLPSNPYNNKFNAECDAGETDITVRDSTGATGGWKFYTQTGIFIAADGAHDNE